MRYLLHQSDPNLSVLACICIFRHQITRHHNKVYSYFVEIAMYPLNLICCNNLGDENYLHLDTCICKAKRQIVRQTQQKRPSPSNLLLCKPPDEERYFNTPVIHIHISDYFLPNIVSVCIYRLNSLQWYVLHHFPYIPQFPHDPDLCLHPNQRR